MSPALLLTRRLSGYSRRQLWGRLYSANEKRRYLSAASLAPFRLVDSATVFFYFRSRHWLKKAALFVITSFSNNASGFLRDSFERLLPLDDTLKNEFYN